MTQPAPRRLLLVASDATPRGTTAPIRRYRLGQVLMDTQDLLGTRASGSGPVVPAPTSDARTGAGSRA